MRWFAAATPSLPLRRTATASCLSAWLLVSFCSPAFSQMPPPTTAPEARIIVTWDRSGSMTNFDHARLRDYVLRLLFDGLAKDYVETNRHIWRVGPVGDGFFQKPLFGPNRELTAFQFGATMDPLSSPLFNRADLAKTAPNEAAFLKKEMTDIASVVERLCEISDQNWSTTETFWVFVSDDEPNAPFQKGDQKARLQALEPLYDWHSILTITVGEGNEPATVQVRMVSNRSFDAIKRKYDAVKMATSPEKVAKAIAELYETATNLRREFDSLASTRKDLDALLDRVRAVWDKVEKELSERTYSYQLAAFDLLSPAAGSPFILTDAITFQWSAPNCAGVSGYVLKVRLKGEPSHQEYPCTDTQHSLQLKTKGVYEWTVAACGSGDVTAECVRTRDSGVWRSFELFDPLGDFKVTAPEPGSQLFRGRGTITWEASANASQYRLKVTLPNGKLDDGISCNGHEAEYKFKTVGEYQLQVVALGAKGFPTKESPAVVFMVGPRPSPSPFERDQPRDRDTRLPRAPGDVRFTWTESNGAERYRLEARLASGLGEPIIKETKLLEASLLLDVEGTWLVTVFALAEDGDETHEIRANGEPWKIDILRAKPPEVGRPFDGMVVRRPREDSEIPFSWRMRGNGGVKSYVVSVYEREVVFDGEVVVPQQEPVREVKVDAPHTTCSLCLPPGEYTWRVTAVFAPGVKSYSHKATFTVKEGGPFSWWLLLLVIVVSGGGAGVWLWLRPITVGLGRTDGGSLRTAPGPSFRLPRARGSASRIYLSEVAGAQWADAGASQHFLERGFNGISLFGPGGRLQTVHFGEPFEAALPDGSTVELVLERASSAPFSPADALPADFLGPETGQRDAYEFGDFQPPKEEPI